jgi:hypothetical protein
MTHTGIIQSLTIRAQIILTVLYKMVRGIGGIIIKAISPVMVVALMGTLRLLQVMRLVDFNMVWRLTLLQNRLIIGLGLCITFMM